LKLQVLCASNVGSSWVRTLTSFTKTL
jgi:hypothetical protein